VRLIISINRGRKIEVCEEDFELAKYFICEIKDPYVVGLDFSGHPAASTFGDFKTNIF